MLREVLPQLSTICTVFIV